MIQYKPKYFSLRELVHPWIINKIGETNSWLRLDPGSLRDLDKIRLEWRSPIHINLGKHDSRGYRPPNDPDGSWNSTHKHGNTFDLVPHNKNYLGLWQMVRDMIKTNQLESFNTLEAFEHTPTWVHCAKMNTNQKPLIINV